MLDEPVNGLDPEGILWIRGLLADLATQSRTVFVSSHLITEISAVAEHLVIIGRGRLIAELPVAELAAGAAGRSVVVRSPDGSRLADAIRGDGVEIRTGADPELLEVTGLTPGSIGRRAAEARRRAVRAEPEIGVHGAGLHGPHPRRGGLPRAPRGPELAENDRSAA